MPPQTNPFDISTTINLRLSGAGGGSLQFPADRPKYYTTIGFQVQKTYGHSAPGGQVILPLPVNIQDMMQVKYDEKPILPYQSALIALSSAFIGYGIGGAPGAAIGASMSGQISDVARTGQQLLGLAPDDWQTILFDRPLYKTHELLFKLSPRSEEESISIREIIRTLNNAMAPGSDGLVFTFPNILNVTFEPNSEFLYRFKPAVITNFAANYVGGNGVKAFYRTSTAPESVELTLQLLEIAYWITNDF